MNTVCVQQILPHLYMYMSNKKSKNCPSASFPTQEMQCKCSAQAHTGMRSSRCPNSLELKRTIILVSNFLQKRCLQLVLCWPKALLWLGTHRGSMVQTTPLMSHLWCVTYVDSKDCNKTQGAIYLFVGIPE